MKCADKKDSLKLYEDFKAKIASADTTTILKECVDLLHTLNIGTSTSVKNHPRRVIRIPFGQEFVVKQLGEGMLSSNLESFIDDFYNVYFEKGFDNNTNKDVTFELDKLDYRYGVLKKTYNKDKIRYNSWLCGNWLRTLINKLQLLPECVSFPEEDNSYRRKVNTNIEVDIGCYKKLSYLRSRLGFTSNSHTIAHLLSCSPPGDDQRNPQAISLHSEMVEILEYINYVKDDVLVIDFSDLLSGLREEERSKKEEGIIQVRLCLSTNTSKTFFPEGGVNDEVKKRLEVLSKGSSISKLQEKKKKPIDRVKLKSELRDLISKLARVRSESGMKSFIHIYTDFLRSVIWNYHGMERFSEANFTKGNVDNKSFARFNLKPEVYNQLFDLSNMFGFKTLTHATAFVVDPNRSTW